MEHFVVILSVHVSDWLEEITLLQCRPESNSNIIRKEVNKNNSQQHILLFRTLAPTHIKRERERELSVSYINY
jgi:hypothetical protein